MEREEWVALPDKVMIFNENSADLAVDISDEVTSFYWAQITLRKILNRVHSSIYNEGASSLSYMHAVF